jgi:hypothetical protein
LLHRARLRDGSVTINTLIFATRARGLSGQWRHCVSGWRNHSSCCLRSCAPYLASRSRQATSTAPNHNTPFVVSHLLPRRACRLHRRCWMAHTHGLVTWRHSPQHPYHRRRRRRRRRRHCRQHPTRVATKLTTGCTGQHTEGRCSVSLFRRRRLVCLSTCWDSSTFEVWRTIKTGKKRGVKIICICVYIPLLFTHTQKSHSSPMCSHTRLSEKSVC